MSDLGVLNSNDYPSRGSKSCGDVETGPGFKASPTSEGYHQVTNST